jgi:hypothetical protein
MSRHIIHKQKITLNLPKREEAFDFQNRVSALLQNELPGNMEAVFDELFPSDDVIRIDTLKLDLGNINPQNFEQEFKDNFIEELRKSLSSKKDKLNDANSEEVLSGVQSLVKSFIYFLEHGHLPWYSSVKRINDWENEILEGFASNKNQYLFNWLRDNYKAKPVVLQRLILQFTDNFLEKLLLTIAPETDEGWGLIYDDLSVVISNCLKKHTSVKHPSVRNEVWKYIFHALLNDPVLWNNAALSGAEDMELVFRALKLLADHFNISEQDISTSKEIEINKQLKTNIVKSAFKELKLFMAAQERPGGDRVEGNYTVDDQKNTEINKLDKDGNGLSKQEEADQAYKLNQNGNKPNQANQSYTNEKVNKAPNPSLKNSKHTSIEHELYIKSCGIVILHYFLAPFFTGLKLLAGGKFIDDIAHQRAVLLLHYLATGNVEVAEFDLILQKILCGYPLDETLPAFIVLSKKEKVESKKLLEAVIDHWTPLKNTSVDGLRNAFFERDGKLTTKENGWLLTVEQRTVDVLLGKLPWGFSTIRLPWMEQILNVDWY